MFKNKLRFKDKPSIKSGLQKVASIKNHYLSQFIRFKDPAKNMKSIYAIHTTETFYRQ